MTARLISQGLIASFVVSTLVFACTAKNERNSAQTALAQNAEPQLVYGDIILQDPSEYAMIPVQIVGAKGLFNKDFKSDYRSDYKSLFVNIVFHNLKTGESHLLLKKKAILSDWEFLELKKEKDKPANKVIFFRVIEKDTNGDQKLDGNDAIAGYLSDLSGKKLQLITPPNTQLTSWKYDQKRGLVFMRIVKDTDNDKKFTQGDDVNFIKVNINKPAVGSQIVSDKIQEEIKSLIK